MKKAISILAIAGFILALAPTTQADIIPGVTATGGNPVWGSVLSLTDGSGLTGTGALEVHGMVRDTQFLAVPSNAWVMFDLGQSYDVSSMKVWNYFADEDFTSHTGRGFKGVTIEYGSAATVATGTWTTQTGTSSINQFAEPTTPGATPGVTYDFVVAEGEAITARYIKFTPTSNWAGNTEYNGLSEVQFTAVPEPATMSLLAIGGIALIRRRRRA
jgi:hypothetical protein